MKTFKLKLTLAVEIDGQGESVDDSILRLHRMINDAVNNGTITGDGPATLNAYRFQVEERKRLNLA